MSSSSLRTNAAFQFKPKVPIDMRVNTFQRLCISLMQNVTQNIWPLCMLICISLQLSLSLSLFVSACFSLLSLIRFQEFPPEICATIEVNAKGCSHFSICLCTSSTWTEKKPHLYQNVLVKWIDQSWNNSKWTSISISWQSVHLRLTLWPTRICDLPSWSWDPVFPSSPHSPPGARKQALVTRQSAEPWRGPLV